MEREALKALKAWKDMKGRKPLVIKGARQVGKTRLMKEFGRLYFKNVVYVNFEDAPELKNLFVQDLHVKRIITALQIYSDQTITPNDTLIIFDEIQSAERGLTSLKYFCEDAPEYAIVAAGSLLGISIHHHTSFPVGKVDFLDIRPMSFFEFLSAVGKKKLSDSIRNKEWDMATALHQTLCDYLHIYLYVGGMPAVVQTYIDTNDFRQVRDVQRNIITSYQADFSKHAPIDIIPRIQMVWQSIPSQLAKENKKFIYGLIREGARAKEFEMAILWLIECGLLLKSNRISKPGMPLTFYQELPTFKLFLVDVGLLSALSNIDPKTLIDGNSIFTEYKGALTEQFVMQELTGCNCDYIGYWTNERSTAEVDFVVQHDGMISPIEVKADVNVRAKSFRSFCDKYKPEHAYRASLRPYHQEDWMTNIPLYSVGCL